MRNFGAIIRTAECTGVSNDAVSRKQARSCNDDTVKTSAGAVSMFQFAELGTLKTVFYLQGSGIKTIAATEKTDQNIYDLSLNEPLAIIMGSEDRGINPSVY